MRRTLVSVLVCVFVAVLSLNALASPVTVSPFNGKSFLTLNATAEIMPTLTSAYNFMDTFTGTMTTSVWSLSTGDYLYLYQADNDGPSVLEILGVSPFYNIKEAGYLTAAEPTGFLSGGLLPVQIPAGSGNYAVTYDATGGANVSFGYYSALNGYVAAGQHTAVLYLVSGNSPTMGSVYAIDGGIASASGYVSSIPEPSSLLAIGFGAAGLLFRRRIKAKR